MNVSDRPSVMNIVMLEMLGATEFLEQHGMHIGVKSNPGDNDAAESLMRDCLRSRVGGFLCHSHGDKTTRTLAEAAIRHSMPLALLNTRMDDLPVDYVTCDNFAGGATSARYLWDLGHRKLAFVSEYGDVSVRDRWEGFRRELAARGVTPACFAPWVDGCDAPTGAFVAAAPSFTAAQCANDSLAARLIRRLVEQGLRVPETISVMGYDNATEHCEHALVPISTIEQPAREIGRRAASLLWERMSHRQPPEPRRVQLAPSLVVRVSASPPASGEA